MFNQKSIDAGSRENHMVELNLWDKSGLAGVS